MPILKIWQVFFFFFFLSSEKYFSDTFLALAVASLQTSIFLPLSLCLTHSAHSLYPSKKNLAVLHTSWFTNCNFLWIPFIVRLCPLHFHQCGDSFANETPAEVCPGPAGRQDGSPLFPSMGASEQDRGGEGLARSSRQFLEQILFNSRIILPQCFSALEHQITLKLPWHQSRASHHLHARQTGKVNFMMKSFSYYNRKDLGVANEEKKKRVSFSRGGGEEIKQE